MALAQRTARSTRRRTSTIVPRERESGVRLRVEPEPTDVRAFAAAAQAAALGLSVCARRARSRAVAEAAASLAARIAEVAARVEAQVPGVVRRASTSERLRWEWLASTASLLDGGAERRLAGEIERHLAIAADAAPALDDGASAAVREAVSLCRLLGTSGEPLATRVRPAFVRL